jgi:hypothetical protein
VHTLPSQVLTGDSLPLASWVLVSGSSVTVSVFSPQETTANAVAIMSTNSSFFNSGTPFDLVTV